jgi:biotin carboxyl carrier protein
MSGTKIYRPEALEHYRRGFAGHSKVLRTPRSWLNWAYWLLAGTCVIGALYVTLGTLDEYATGPAVVRAIGQSTLTVQVGGTVHSVNVAPGQHVAEGQILAELDSTLQSAEADRVQREFDGALAVSLRDPGDATAKKQLATLQAQLQAAQTSLEQRGIRSPRAGTVGDVRIRQGQAVNAGDAVVVLTPEHARFRVVMALPGEYRPMLHPGLGARFELSGFKYAYQSLSLDSVAGDVVGPQEARRFLGADVGDAVSLSGPVVISEAPLNSDGFKVDGQFYNYYDGMQGIAQARARRSRILVLFLPWIRTLLEPSV